MSPIATDIPSTLASFPAKLASVLPGSNPTLRLPHFSAPLPANKPYVLESDQGETITLVGSGSVMRYLATAKETDDQFAIVHTRARADEPVPAQ